MAIGTCDSCDRHNVPVRHLVGTWVGDTTQCFLCMGDTDPDPYGELEEACRDCGARPSDDRCCFYCKAD